ncbi:PepSY-like domain-containing protein [Salegentibacter sediminis]|uniref:PepSY-like domain-containing protein n=1 Tax=Salegentibacter sediminis TaxID=1930251 RepID=UPI0009C09D25|nr:PepSY-like domain-containing protein [Salegentibacter sediminis]
MKKLIVTAVFTIFSLSVFAQTNNSKLPEKAQNYISEYFSSDLITEVEENSQWKVWEDEKFEVRLSNGIEIDFDENGNALEIDSKGEESLPLEALPEKLAQYLQENYPDSQVKSWEKDRKAHEIELTNDVELEFNSEGEFVKID